jgi:hypothetical protein
MPPAAAEHSHPGAQASYQLTHPIGRVRSARPSPPDRQGPWMAPRGPVFPSAEPGAHLMAKIVSAGRSGPLTPTSETRVTPNPSSPHAHTNPSGHSAPQSRHALALCDAVVPQHRRHYPAGTSLDTRYTGCDARAVFVLKDRYTKRNNRRYIRAHIAHDLRYILRDIRRSSGAYRARVVRWSTVFLAPPWRVTSACNPPLLALLLHAYRAHLALCLRARRAWCASCRAQQLRPTRAIVVAYRRECDAILAPMNPPLLPHTRATAPHHARRTGAAIARALNGGGLS